MKKTQSTLLLLCLTCLLSGCSLGGGNPSPSDGQDTQDSSSGEDTDSCQDPGEDESGDDTECGPIEALSYLGLFKDEPGAIAENLARVLDVEPVEFNAMVSTSDEPVELWEAPFVEEGYQYETADEGEITVWVDAQDRPNYITYLYTRWPDAEDHSYGLQNVEDDAMALLPDLCVILDGSEEIAVQEFSGVNLKIFDVTIQQVFEGEPAAPYVHAEFGGDDGALNFLKLPRWYTNLDEICQVLPDEELQALALAYFQASDEVYSIPEEIGVGGHTIMDDHPCKVMGPAVLDEWGSTMFLHMDIQTGDVVYVERVWVGM